MAPPALESIENFSDVRFRDIVTRHQYQVAPSSNIIHKLYNHVNGNTANVSAADVVSIDADNQGQWDLMLSTSSNRLDANIITTANTAAWSANSIISVRQATTAIRSTNVAVNNLVVAGTMDAQNLEATGVINTSSGYRVGNVPVIGANALGTAIQYSNLQTVGRLNSLKVNGEMNVGYKKRKEFIISGLTTGNGVEFCEVYHFEGGAYLMEITLVQSKSQNQNAKYYKFPITNSATGGLWRSLLPLVSDGIGPNDFIMQIKVQAGVANFRILRVLGANNSGDDIAISMTTDTSPYGLANDITITQFNIVLDIDMDTALGASIYSGTMLTSTKNVVGVNAFLSEDPSDNPDNVRFFVDGNVSVTDTIMATKVSANVISADSLQVSKFEPPAGGEFQIDQMKIESFTFTLAAGLNAAKGICEIIGKAYHAELIITGSNQKKYEFSPKFPNSEFQRLLPSSMAGVHNLEFSVEILYNIVGGVHKTSLRVVNLENVGSRIHDLTCTIKTYEHPDDPVTIEPYAVSGTVTPATGYWKRNSVMTQAKGRVGILNEDPLYDLDVNGVCNAKDGFYVDGQRVIAKDRLGDDILGSNLTSVGILNGLTVAGDILGSGIDFRKKWRIFIDPADDALVIQRNLADETSSTPNWVRSAVLAQL